MAIPRLANDFREFLKLLNWNGVEYLPIGGYAVGAHGYIRGLHPGVTSGGYIRGLHPGATSGRRTIWTSGFAAFK